MPPPQDTVRLRFRDWAAGDIELARQLWGDPAVTALIDSRPKLDEAAVEERMQREVQNVASSGVCYWQGGAVATPPASSRPLPRGARRRFGGRRRASSLGSRG
jgi:hypothetical protein